MIKLPESDPCTVTPPSLRIRYVLQGQTFNNSLGCNWRTPKHSRLVWALCSNDWPETSSGELWFLLEQAPFFPSGSGFELNLHPNPFTHIQMLLIAQLYFNWALERWLGEGRKSNNQFAFSERRSSRWSANEQFDDPLIGISFVHGRQHRVPLECECLRGSGRRVSRDNDAHQSKANSKLPHQSANDPFRCQFKCIMHYEIITCNAQHAQEQVFYAVRYRLAIDCTCGRSWTSAVLLSLFTKQTSSEHGWTWVDIMLIYWIACKPKQCFGFFLSYVIVWFTLPVLFISSLLMGRHVDN